MPMATNIDVGHGEASPAKAVQAAESRLFTVEVAKRRAGDDAQ